MWPPDDEHLDEWAETMLKPLAGVWTFGTWTRALAKAISYRIANSLVTVVVATIITGNLSMAFAIGGIEILVKTVGFYVHERIWSMISTSKEKR